MLGIRTSLKTAFNRVFQPNGVFTGVKIAARFFYGEMLKNPAGIVGMITNGYEI